MAQNTHQNINIDLVGRVLESESDHFARVSLVTTQEMVTDEKGLVHGGFTFSLADYAAMAAVDDPNVVLSSAQVQFIRPVKVGDILLALARVEKKEDRKRLVAVDVRVADKTVFKGEFVCFITEKHVLD